MSGEKAMGWLVGLAIGGQPVDQFHDVCVAIPELFAPAFPWLWIGPEVGDVRVGIAVEEEGADRWSEF
jgi:hypothetical protein